MENTTLTTDSNSFEKVWLMFEETDRQFKETDQKIKESFIVLNDILSRASKKTDKKINQLENLFYRTVG